MWEIFAKLFFTYLKIMYLKTNAFIVFYCGTHVRVKLQQEKKLRPSFCADALLAV